MQQTPSDQSTCIRNQVSRVKFISLVTMFTCLLLGSVFCVYFFKYVRAIEIQTTAINSTSNYARLINLTTYRTDSDDKSSDRTHQSVKRIQSTIDNAAMQFTNNAANNLTIKLYNPQKPLLKKSTGEVHLDPYEKKAWLAIKTTPSLPYIKLEVINKQLSVRFTQAYQVESDCTSCHKNSYFKQATSQPERSIIAALEIIKPIQEQINQNNQLLVIVLAIYWLSIISLYSIYRYLLNYFQDCQGHLETQYKLLLSSIADLKLTNNKLLNQARQDELLIARNNQDKQHLINIDNEKSIFLAYLSHEIKQPLGLILDASTAVLSCTQKENQIKELGQSINLNASHLLELTSNLLNFSVSELQQAKIKTNNFNLVFECKKLFNSLKIRAQQKSLLFEFHNLTAKEQIFVNADLSKLRQILFNLLSNALKFTNHGSVTFTLSSSEESIFMFSIRDTGIGIKADQLQQLLTPHNFFNQTDPIEQTMKQKISLGLGLSVVKQNLALMRSHLHLDSTQNDGSVFSFKLCLPEQLSIVGSRSVIYSPPLSSSNTKLQPFTKTAHIESTKSPNQTQSFSLPSEISQLIIEQSELYLVLEVEQLIEKLFDKYPDNHVYIRQLQHFVSNYDLDGLTSFLKGDLNE
jgi:signal transduction histidine kinase